MTLDEIAKGSSLSLTPTQAILTEMLETGWLAQRPSHVDGAPVLVLWLPRLKAINPEMLDPYAQSDQRIFEMPCPACGTFAEITWEAITWDEGAPETARWRCPNCAEEIEERHKPAMVEERRWRALRPEVSS